MRCVPGGRCCPAQALLLPLPLPPALMATSLLLALLLLQLCHYFVPVWRQRNMLCVRSSKASNTAAGGRQRESEGTGERELRGARTS